MARAFDGSTQYARNTATPVTTFPLTISCWYNPAALPANNTTQALVSIVAPTSSTDEFILAYVHDDSIGYHARTSTFAAAGYRLNYLTTLLTLGTWYHILGVWTSASSQSIYVNGSAGGIDFNTADPSPASVTDLFVGAMLYNTSTLFGMTNGSIAEVGVWDVDLTAAEIALLAKGYSPTAVRPGNLGAYVPFIGRASPEQNLCGTAMTLTASPAAANHPRVLNPRHRQLEYKSGVSVQYLRPSSDVTDGAWTPSTGADNYAVIDETVASDADYTVTPSASAVTVALATGTDPLSSAGHKVRYRIRGTGTLVAALMQGASTIASWTHSPAPGNWTTYTRTLSGAEADAITNYADLRLKFTAS